MEVNKPARNCGVIGSLEEGDAQVTQEFGGGEGPWIGLDIAIASEVRDISSCRGGHRRVWQEKGDPSAPPWRWKWRV